MQPTPMQQSPDAALKVVQIVVGAFVLGISTFAGVTAMLVFTGQSSKQAPFPLQIGVIVWIVALVGTTGLSIIMRNVVASQIRRQIDRGESAAGEERSLMGRFSQLTIIRAVLHEGPALLGLVLSFLSGHWIGFLAAGVGLVLLASVFPTRGRFDTFVRDCTGRMIG